MTKSKIIENLGVCDWPQVSKDWTSKLVARVGQLLQLASMELEAYKSKFEPHAYFGFPSS
jgi:hypothetical protein